ncbi:MAG: manganese catalase family protein [Ruminococcus sp.]|nr:manganese catalase family protein [Ruminococcus sp.]
MYFKSNLPYPKVQVEKKNPYYAKLLLEDYAGENSEDTAIHLYLYESLVLSEEHQEYKKILMSIAEVEMHHLRLLGKTIKELGLKPIYGSIINKDNISYWNSSYVNYNINIKDILILDIKREETAIKSYKKHRSIINDRYIYTLLTKIISDEEIHLKIFKDYLNYLTCK